MATSGLRTAAGSDPFLTFVKSIFNCNQSRDVASAKIPQFTSILELSYYNDWIEFSRIEFRYSDLEDELDQIDEEPKTELEIQNILIKLLESNVASLCCQISSLLQEKNELEKQEIRIGVLEKENQKLKHCQEETPTKGEFDLYFCDLIYKRCSLQTIILVKINCPTL